MSSISAGISSYSSFLKISVTDGKRYINYSEKIINFEEIMFNKINEMTRKFGIKFSDINHIHIIRGPGRFTGIRASYAFASVYSAISGCKISGTTVFEHLVYNFFEKKYEDGDIRVVLNAFKDEYYLAEYSVKKSKINLKIKPLWLSKNELVKKMKGFKGTVITDDEDNPDIYRILSEFKIADRAISKIIPENIIKASFYFKNKDISPFYLKPAKFEL